MHIGTNHLLLQGTTHQKTAVSVLWKFPFKPLSPGAWILPLAVHLTSSWSRQRWWICGYGSLSISFGTVLKVAVTALSVPMFSPPIVPLSCGELEPGWTFFCLPAKQVFLKQTLEELKLWLEDTAISSRNTNLSYCSSPVASSGSFPVSCHLLHSNHTRVCNIMCWTQSMNQSRL